MSELAPPPRRELEEELREPRLRERLATRLTAEIVSGRMKPADAFPSAEDIVQQYGVSRTVARETVQTLSMLGLVRVRHGKRTEVLPSTEWDVLSPLVQEALRRNEGDATPLLHDLYEYRLLVEPRAAALMAERGPDAAIEELAALAARMRALASGGAELDQVMSADRDFHDLVARASGNTIVAAISRDIGEVLTTLWTLSRMSAADLDTVARQHDAIATAVVARDAKLAEATMREHLSWASTLDLSHLSED